MLKVKEKKIDEEGSYSKKQIEESQGSAAVNVQNEIGARLNSFHAQDMFVC